MELRLDGKVALVTGAFGGLGRDFAGMLARAGAAVALAGRRLGEGRALADALRRDGARAEAFAMDVTDRSSVDAAVERAEAALGPIDVLVNNAGVAVTRPFVELTEREWRDVLDVNLDGAFRVAQAVARRMRAAGRGGSIVNIASVLGERVAAQVAPYAASKAALIQLTRAMAVELARDGIRVNALAPGYVLTPINQDFFATEAGQALVKRVPQRRLGRAEDLEGPLLLLCSDASSFMTGATIAVDGGHAISPI
jgi:NAD(P)-dependent dehydrogenase (short-subunit alcohol dehydrogenase family)